MMRKNTKYRILHFESGILALISSGKIQLNQIISFDKNCVIKFLNITKKLFNYKYSYIK